MRIAVIGGAGSGKSHVTNYLKDKYGALLLEADKIAHKLYEPGEEGYACLTGLFGDTILTDDFKIDRKKLGSILYSDPVLLKRVDEMIHPLVYREIYKVMDTSSENLIAYEAAIMPEDPSRFDTVWYVKSDQEIRRRRLITTRGYSDARVDEIFANQASDQEYETMADHVICNNGTFSGLEAKVDEIMACISF